MSRSHWQSLSKAMKHWVFENYDELARLEALANEKSNFKKQTATREVDGVREATSADMPFGLSDHLPAEPEPEPESIAKPPHTLDPRFLKLKKTLDEFAMPDGLDDLLDELDEGILPELCSNSEDEGTSWPPRAYAPAFQHIQIDQAPRGRGRGGTRGNARGSSLVPVGLLAMAAHTTSSRLGVVSHKDIQIPEPITIEQSKSAPEIACWHRGLHLAACGLLHYGRLFPMAANGRLTLVENLKLVTFEAKASNAWAQLVARRSSRGPVSLFEGFPLEPCTTASEIA